MINIRKIVLAVNNKNGLNALRIIKDNENMILEAIILHPDKKAKYKNEIIKESGLSKEKIINWGKKSIGDIIARIKKESSGEVLLSVNFGYIIPKEILDIFQINLNLHTGYLPWNKGSHPNVWPFIDGSPAGVTLHIMTPDLDCGPIVKRNKVEINEMDTAKTLYNKLENESEKLLTNSLVDFLEGRITPFYPKNEGSYHNHKDFLSLLEMDTDKKMKFSEFVNLLRALSFPPFKNAFYRKNGNKIFIDLSMEEE